MRTKITFTLIFAALSSSAMAQQPTISIADSTGRRDAVVAIVVPTAQEIKQQVDQNLPASPKPWTSYFLGQTKPVSFCTRSQCYIGNIKIDMDGTVGYSDQYSPHMSAKLFDYPQWNEPLTRNSSSTYGCGGRSGQTYTSTTNIRVAPTGVSINQLTPTGWTASYQVSGSGC